MIAADSKLEYYICIYIYKHIPPLQILFCFIGETYTSDMWICFFVRGSGPVFETPRVANGQSTREFIGINSAIH